MIVRIIGSLGGRMTSDKLNPALRTHPIAYQQQMGRGIRVLATFTMYSNWCFFWNPGIGYFFEIIFEVGIGGCMPLLSNSVFTFVIKSSFNMKKSEALHQTHTNIRATFPSMLSTFTSGFGSSWTRASTERITNKRFQKWNIGPIIYAKK